MGRVHRIHRLHRSPSFLCLALTVTCVTVHNGLYQPRGRSHPTVCHHRCHHSDGKSGTVVKYCKGFTCFTDWFTKTSPSRSERNTEYNCVGPCDIKSVNREDSMMNWLSCSEHLNSSTEHSRLRSSLEPPSSNFPILWGQLSNSSIVPYGEEDSSREGFTNCGWCELHLPKSQKLQAQNPAAQLLRNKDPFCE